MRNSANIVTKPNIQENRGFFMNPRCLTILEQSCKSKRTFGGYKWNLVLRKNTQHKLSTQPPLPKIRVSPSPQISRIFLASVFL